jgi:pimeloyl-ACP methyl ester carboxylesterase
MGQPRLGPAEAQPTHPIEVQHWYEGLLAGTSVVSRTVQMPTDGRVHLLETGDGPPLVLLHGSGVAAGFFLPLLNELHGVHAIAPDLPGSGLSDRFDRRRQHYFDDSVDWLDRLFDTLGLETVSLVGHSGGGVWALRYSLAHRTRVERLVLIGLPSLPGTRCPLPHRLMAAPGLGRLIARVPPTPSSVLRFAASMGEGATLAKYPNLVDMFVVSARDPVAAAAFRAELHALISPFALLTRSGWGAGQVRSDELRRVALPTLLIGGERDPLGDGAVARAVTDVIPDARLRVLPTGHGPWLGEPVLTSSTILDFLD